MLCSLPGSHSCFAWRLLVFLSKEGHVDQRIGTQLGNYRIVEVIARGAYGIVYRAEHIHLGYSVAIKFIHAYLNTLQQQASFRQEAQTLVKLRHPNTVRLLDFGIVDEESPYLVSEYASGGSLRDYLEQQASQPLPLQDARRILAQVGHALTYVHSQGIIHRDLKPENILFDSDGKALLADFGIARVKRTMNAGRQGSAASLVGLGTPAYMAPEQFQSKGEPQPQSDQYALGCVAYELLTGQLPFQSDNPVAYGFQHLYEPPQPLRSHNPTLPLRIEQAVLTALAKDPAERHAHVEAFLTALGIRRPAPTQTAASSDTTLTGYRAAISGSDDSTLIKEPEQVVRKSKMITERIPPHRVSPSPSVASTPAHTTRSQQSVQTTLPPRSAPPSFKITEPAQRTLSSDTRGKLTPGRFVLQAWKQIQSVVTTTSLLLLTKRLFLVAALLDVVLLLGGLWLGLSPFTLAGTILAIGICVCGLALNLFMEPWIWMVIFLLFSPLSGALYVFAINVLRVGNVMNWQTFCAYLLLTPVAGMLYGLFGPLHPRVEMITPNVTKKLMVTIWFLGAGIFAVGFGAPVLMYVGLSWALASGVLATVQAIRHQDWEWLTGIAMASAMFLGIPLLVWGLIYGIIGPTGEERHKVL